MYLNTQTKLRGRLVEVSIEIGSMPQTIYREKGQLWVEALYGAHYSIVVRNLFGRRLEIVESVDAQDVLENIPASLQNGGMVITGTWKNHGYRLDDNHVADFVFGLPARSVAAQEQGSTRNVGAIGVAVYEEYRREQYLESHALRGSETFGGVAKGLTMRGGRSDAGTQMGEERFDPVGHTHFQRVTHDPAEMWVIQYRFHEGLVEEGILDIVSSHMPEPFPGHESTTGYRHVKDRQ